jgi:hypothetical protein
LAPQGLNVERQLTFAPHGHILANAAVWSPDGEWLVYDVRSDAAGSVFDGTRIERVHVATGEVQVLYESRRGACCGVPMCSPVDGRVAFILGPENPTPEWEYAAWHRRGLIVDPDRPGVVTDLEACDVAAPFTPGALRGGSHVHQFSPDGRLVSFTYEDHVLAADVRATGDRDLNQRNVAVAFPGAVRAPRSHPRNHDGEFFSVVVTETVNDPRPGSDEISRAYEEAWIGGGRGQALLAGRQVGGDARSAILPGETPVAHRFGADNVGRRLAFLGDLIAADGRRLTEAFVVELPADLTRAGEWPLEGTATRRPAPPWGTRQRRLTQTADRPYPGMQGPRFWPRSSPDGSRIGLLMRDERGAAQLWTVSPAGGEPRQVTRDRFAVGSAFTWSPDGSQVAYVADGSVMVVDAESGRSRRLTKRLSADDGPRPEACVFSPEGSQIAFVRQVEGGAGRFNQVFVAPAE